MRRLKFLHYFGRFYSAYRAYGLNGGLLLYTERGEIYINPDGREVRVHERERSVAN